MEKRGKYGLETPPGANSMKYFETLSISFGIFEVTKISTKYHTWEFPKLFIFTTLQPSYYI